MNWNKLVIWLLALLLAAAPAAIGEEAACVRVGSTVYTTAEVQQALDRQLQALDIASMTQEDKESLKQLVMESFVSTTIFHNRYLQYGLDQMSEGDAALFHRMVEEAYPSLVSQMTREVAQAYGFTEEAAKPVAMELLNGYGYTEEAVRQARISALELDRLAAYLNIETGEADQDAYYQENLVRPSKELYESDPEAYDLLLQSETQEVYYVPAGCRRVEQLVLGYPAELQAELNRLDTQMEEALAAADDALGKWNAAKEGEAGSLEAQQAYNDQCAAYAALETQRNQRRAAGLAAALPTVEEIKSRYQAGEAFAALIGEYEGASAMPQGGYIVRAGSQVWPEELMAAVAQLSTVGDLSEPFATESGIHLLRYAQELPEGAAEPDERTQQQLHLYAAADARDAQLKIHLSNWLTDYHIVMDGSGLVIP